MEMITTLQKKVERLEQLEQKVAALEQEKEMWKNESLNNAFDQISERNTSKREQKSPSKRSNSNNKCK